MVAITLYSSGIQYLPALPATPHSLQTTQRLAAAQIRGPIRQLCPPQPTNNANLCVSSPVVSAMYFMINNSNGTLDPGENFRRTLGQFVKRASDILQTGRVIGESSADLGSITATIGNPPFYTAVPGSVSHTFSRYDTIVHDLIALQPSVIFDSLRINIIPSFAMRPGFDFVYIVRYVGMSGQLWSRPRSPCP